MKCEKCHDTGKRYLGNSENYGPLYSEMLDCGFCDLATERAEFNKRLKEAGSMSVEDAAWWAYMQAMSYRGMVENFARASGWTPQEDEGAFEWVQRKSYELGYEDAYSHTDHPA